MLTRPINELQTGGVNTSPLSGVTIKSSCDTFEFLSPISARLSFLVYMWFWISSPPDQKEALMHLRLFVSWKKKHQMKKLFCTEAV